MKSFPLTLLVCLLSLLIPNVSKAQQTDSDEFPYLMDEWKHAFSQEGIKSWKPEFTGRIDMGIYAGGAFITGGVRIDEKRTLGLLVGEGNVHIDAVPGHISTIRTGLMFRRYVHLGKRKIFALYSDIYAGAAIVYKVTGKYYSDPETGEMREEIDTDKGDVGLLLGWQPGIRVRFYKNIHLFLGPSIATDCIGVHLGVGF